MAVANRAEGGGCAGCAQAHPIFGSSLSKDYVYSRKLWSWVLVCTPNVQWLPPALKVIGNFSGLIVKEIVDTLDKNVQHKASKKIEKFLEGFDPEDEQWIQFILNCFCEIFIK